MTWSATFWCDLLHSNMIRYILLSASLVEPPKIFNGYWTKGQSSILVINNYSVAKGICNNTNSANFWSNWLFLFTADWHRTASKKLINCCHKFKKTHKAMCHHLKMTHHDSLWSATLQCDPLQSDVICYITVWSATFCDLLPQLNLDSGFGKQLLLQP